MEHPSPAADQAHWNAAYDTRGETGVSWFQSSPTTSLELLEAEGITNEDAVIDVGGGASTLVDALVDGGYRDVTVLDVADVALALAAQRLGERASGVQWRCLDIRDWTPERTYDIWHDRAVFHFLTSDADRRHYVEALRQGLAPTGIALFGTFALDGPTHCSGLEVVRYDAASLAVTLGPSFAVTDLGREEHRTPQGATQHFQWCVVRHALTPGQRDEPT